MPRKSRRTKNSGSVRHRKDGRYEARVTIGYRDNGAPIQRSRYAHTQQAAEEHLVKLYQEHALTRALEQEVEPLDPANLTVGQLVDEHIELRPSISDDTRRKMSRGEAKHVKRLLGEKTPTELTVRDVRLALATMEREEHSHRTRTRFLQLLRAALDDAVNDELMTRNVATSVKVGAASSDETPQIKALNETEVTLVLKALSGRLIPKRSGGLKAKQTKEADQLPELVEVPADEAEPHPLFALFYLMLALGLRPGEAFGLPWDAVDFNAKVIHIKQTLSKIGELERFQLKSPKTANSRRTLPFDSHLHAVLQEHKARQEGFQAIMRADWRNDQNLVFTTGIGTQYSPRNGLRTFKARLKPLPVTQINLHGLRHTYATLSLRAGVPAEVVSRMLGHMDVSTTLDIYRHVFDDELVKGARSMDVLIADLAAENHEKGSRLLTLETF